MSTNFQQWNPTAANQENDAAYAADPQRTGGAPVGAVFPSMTGNKLFYQVSTLVTAFATALATQLGVAVNDTNIATLTSQILLAIFPSIVAVAFSATPVFDESMGSTFEITLTGNVTSSTFINVKAGTVVRVIIHQDGTGGRTFVPPGNLPIATIDPGANNTSVQEFLVDSAGTAHPLGPLTVS